MKQLIFLISIFSFLGVSGQSMRTEARCDEQVMYAGNMSISSSNAQYGGSMLVPDISLTSIRSNNTGVHLTSHRRNFGVPTAIAGGVVIVVTAGVIVANYDANKSSNNSKLTDRQLENWGIVGGCGIVICWFGLAVDKFVNSEFYSRNFAVVGGSNQVGIAYCFR